MFMVTQHVSGPIVAGRGEGGWGAHMTLVRSQVLERSEQRTQAPCDLVLRHPSAVHRRIVAARLSRREASRGAGSLCQHDFNMGSPARRAEAGKTAADSCTPRRRLLPDRRRPKKFPSWTGRWIQTTVPRSMSVAR